MDTNETTLRALAHEAVDHADPARLEDVIAILEEPEFSSAEIRQIDSLLAEGLASGAAEEMTRSDWTRLRDLARDTARLK